MYVTFIFLFYMCLNAFAFQFGLWTWRPTARNYNAMKLVTFDLRVAGGWTNLNYRVGWNLSSTQTADTAPAAVSLAWIMYLFLLYTAMYDGQSWTAAFLTTVSLGWWDVPYTCIVDRIRTARAGGCGPPNGANVCNDRYHFSMSITVA